MFHRQPPRFPPTAASPDERRRAIAADPARALLRDESGAIVIVAALSLLVLMGAAAMALDLSEIYFIQSLDQRIADQSALAAAFAYGQSSSSTTAAQNASSSLAVTNGAGNSTVTTTIVNSPSGDGNKAAKVVVTTPVSISPFGRYITTSAQNPGGLATVTVGASAYAEIQNQVAPCIIALTGTGVSATGGTSVAATSCAIDSAGSVTASSGPTLTAQAVYAVGTISPSSCAGTGACVQTSPTSGQLFPGSSAPSDPFASSNVFSRIPTVQALTAASFPSATVGSAPAGGTAQSCSGTLTVPSGHSGTISTSYYPTCSTINFSGGAETDIAGSGLSLTGNSVTLNFAAGTYKINGITVSGSTAVTINTTGTVVFEIWNGINLSGSTSLAFNGTATYYVMGGINDGASGSLTFNNTSASSPSTFYVAGGISISNGSASFPNGRYTVTSGGSSAGLSIGANTSFGNGSFNIANGISVGGGKTLSFGAQLDSSSVFQVTSADSAGNSLDTGGGSSFTVGSFPNFDFNGPISLAGGAQLGSGTYTVNGAFNASASGGNSISGSAVSIIASGAIAFGAGYNSVNLTAPTAIASATDGAAATIALASQSTSSSSITAGASSTVVVGAVYTPNAALTLNGAGNLTGNGACLQVVSSSISLSGSGQISTTCSGLGSNSGGSVALIQ